MRAVQGRQVARYLRPRVEPRPQRHRDVSADLRRAPEQARRDGLGQDRLQGAQRAGHEWLERALLRHRAPSATCDAACGSRRRLDAEQLGEDTSVPMRRFSNRIVNAPVEIPEIVHHGKN